MKPIGISSVNVLTEMDASTKIQTTPKSMLIDNRLLEVTCSPAWEVAMRKTYEAMCGQK